ncbi:MAG TPA: VWA domain-containing protein [Thermoanaerobaculia bacterium]|nr:VWA domain-containing protein [Thermoanaerobaculia bacterium]
MREARLAVVALAAALVALGGGAARAANAPEVRIVAPGPNDILVGITTVEVRVTGLVPGDIVEVWADGRLAGSLAAEPWTLVWNAGSAPRPHNLEAVLRRGGIEAAVSRTRTRGLGFAATAEARVVSLSPIVTDADGRYVRGLSREDFTLLVDGRSQEIETFEATNSSLSVVLVLDVSSSMSLKLRDARAAALEFLAALKPGDRAAVLTFASNVVGFTPFSTDRSAARQALEDAKVSGETALYDAAAVALRGLRQGSGRRAVVLFTDGEDNRSRMSIDQVIDLARTNEASVFAVAQGVAEVKALLRGLDRLAEETGGRAWFISTIRKLPGVFREVVAELENQYFLTFTPTDQRPKSWHNVEVGTNRPGLTVRARKSFRIE